MTLENEQSVQEIKDIRRRLEAAEDTLRQLRQELLGAGSTLSHAAAKLQSARRTLESMDGTLTPSPA